MVGSDALYEEHRPIIEKAVNTALAIAKHPPLIEFDDLVQLCSERWLALVSKWDGDNPHLFERYLFRCCLNRCFDNMRKNKQAMIYRAPEQAAVDVPSDLEGNRTVDLHSDGNVPIDMAQVKALGPEIEQVVMEALDLEECEDGSVVGRECQTGRIPLRGSFTQRRRTKAAVRTLIGGEPVART